MFVFDTFTIAGISVSVLLAIGMLVLLSGKGVN